MFVLLVIDLFSSCMCCCHVSLVYFLTGVHLYDENGHRDQEITSLNTGDNAIDQNSKRFFSICFLKLLPV